MGDCVIAFRGMTTTIWTLCVLALVGGLPMQGTEQTKPAAARVTGDVRQTALDQPAGFDITFGEMEPAKKHAMSHRADAFRLLVHACFGNRAR